MRDPVGAATEPSSRPTADAPLNRLLGQVERQVTRRLEPVLASAGLSIDQWRVLDLLIDGRGVPMSEIAATIVVPGPTLTKIVDKLVDLALVYRLVDDRDRRRVLAFVSDKGRVLHARVQPEVVESETGALETIERSAAVTLVDLLGRLARA